MSIGKGRQLNSSISSLTDILASVKSGALAPQHAEKLIDSFKGQPAKTPGEAVKAFANLDHTRSFRTGFPEVVFAETKTPKQVAMIMDDMARYVNEAVESGSLADASLRVNSAILATRVTPEMNKEIEKMSFEHGTATYNEQARILSLRASSLEDEEATKQPSQYADRVVVATAGTTDLPVAEEAAMVLEAAGCEVDRIFDVGVAGLHRVIGALPRLQDDKVGAVIVCAGMDGALPSVVGGLVDVPVFAVPTSVGYGVSLGGVAAMLTMLNSCAPGVSVLNVDNGFGAATCAFKIIRKSKY